MPNTSHEDVRITRDANGERLIETTRPDGSKGVIRTTDTRTEGNKR